MRGRTPTNLIVNSLRAQFAFESAKNSAVSRARLSLVSIVVTVPVSIALMIPMVIVVEPPAIAIPIASKKLPPVMAGPSPMGTRIRWTSPIALVPPVAASRRVPVALNPDEIGSWSGRQNSDNTRRRRRPNPNSNGDLGESRWAANHQCECQ